MASLENARKAKFKEYIANEAKLGSCGAELGSCGAEPPDYYASTLVDQIRVEKAKISKRLNQRLRELTRVENLLLNSDAEALLKEAQETLWKES